MCLFPFSFLKLGSHYAAPTGLKLTAIPLPLLLSPTPPSLHSSLFGYGRSRPNGTWESCRKVQLRQEFEIRPWLLYTKSVSAKF